MIRGLGVWGHDQGVPAGPWSFAFVIAGVRYREQVAEVRARGITPYLWLGPFHWTPAEWRSTLPFIVGRAREVGARGIGVDLENEWPTMHSSDRRALFQDLGAALGEVARSGLEVVVTSFPSLPDLETLVSAAGGRGVLTGNAQIYGISAQDGASFARWHRKWIESFGADRATISFAAEPWGRNAYLREPGAFAAYLELLPQAPAAVAWYEGATLDASYLARVATWAARRSWSSPAWLGPVIGGLAAVGAFALALLLGRRR